MIDRQLGGRYQIIQQIGRGGMSEVYKAMDIYLERYVAVKMLNHSLEADPELVQRFIREAKSTASLSHPNVVNVYDVGIEDQSYYMVMEYIEGSTLREMIDQQAPFPPEKAVAITLQILAGLAHAHENGIVHRDIKPHNIMLTRDGRAKVTDFGISRVLHASSPLTRTGTVMGTVHYFSPEQARGQEMGFSSDLYSLGVVLYEMLTGKLPFDADENIAIALKHIQEPVPDPRNYNRYIPVDLVEVIYQALEKQPEHRFQTAQEMSEALQKAQLHSVHFELNQQSESAIVGTTSQADSTSFPRFQAESQTQSHLTRVYPKRKNKKSVIKKLFIALVSILCLFIFLGAGAKWVKSRSAADRPSPNIPAENPAPDTVKDQDNQDQNTTTKPNPQPSKVFKVFAGAFDKKENARMLQNNLRKKGFDPKIVEITFLGKKIYRVQVGQFKSLEGAQARMDKLREAGFETVVYEE